MLKGRKIKEVYIAAPFTSKTNEIEGRKYGKVCDFEFIKFLERIEDVFIQAGFKTNLPHRDEGEWGKIYIKPEKIAKLCYDIISKCELVVALPKKSRGVHAEIGFASALKKKLIILLERGEDCSIFILGQVEVTDTTIIHYSDENDLITQLQLLVSKNR